MIETRPTSSIAARVYKGVMRRLVGRTEVLGAELGPLTMPEERTTEQDHRKTATDHLTDILWASEADASRRGRYDLYEELYRTPEIRQILGHMVSFIFGGEASDGAHVDPFRIEFAAAAKEETVEEIERAVAAMRLNVHIPQQVQSGLLKGDAFAEIVHSPVEVVALRPRFAKSMTVQSRGGAVLAYVHRTGDSLSGYSRVLTPLQVVHYAPHPRWGHQYGQSLFYGLPSVGRQFNAAIDVIHVLLVLFSTNRRTATVAVPGGWTDDVIKSWIKQMRLWATDGGFFDAQGRMQKRIAPLLDFADKIWPYRQGTAAPTFHNEPPAPFDKLLEVATFDQKRLYLGTGFPMALAGDLEGAAGLGGGGALTAADLALARVLRKYQADAAQLVIEYVVRAALIAEVPLESGDIKVVMPPVGSFNEKLIAETLELRAKAAGVLKLSGVPMRWILREVLKVPLEELDDVLAAMPPEPQAPEPQDASLEQLRSMLGEKIELLTEAVALIKPVEAQVDSTVR